MLKADYNDWVNATVNLKERRKLESTNDDNLKLDNTIRDYQTHLYKCGFGSSILDVGCGRQFLKQCLPKKIKYIGIDAFPAEGFEDVTLPIAIESNEALELSEDTICAFAVLDNCLDFDLAIKNMKKIARQNIIILTGIGIEVDQYHTLKLELEDFDSRFTDWTCTHREELFPKVWLLNFDK